MKKIFLAILICIPFVFVLYVQHAQRSPRIRKVFTIKHPPKPRPTANLDVIPYTPLIRAMIDYESTGNDHAYNEKSKAAGCMQIRPIMVKEVNRILKLQESDVRFSLLDRWDRRQSIRMFNVWRLYWHRSDSDEVIARCWNGGTNGDKKESTVGYWRQIKKRM